MEKTLEKVKNIIGKIINCRQLYYIAVIILFMITYYIDLRKKFETENILIDNYSKYYLIVAGILGIVCLITVLFSKKMYQKLKPHVVYMILAIIFGSIYIGVVPLCSQSDEPEHILRTFQVARGEIISPKDENGFITKLPKSVVDIININSETKKREHKKYYDIKEMAEIKLNEEETVDVRTTGNYHGSSYFPQAIGVKIGLILKLNPYYTAMLGRITGLIITVLLLGFGIKKLPSHKLFAIIVLLSPVALSYAASYTADNIILISVFLMISYVLHYMQTKEKIKKCDYAIFVVLTFIVAISKMAYIPIIGILLFIPKECFEKKKGKIIFEISYIVLGLASALWWMKMTGISAGSSDTAAFSNTWIYSKPLSYIIVLFRTTIYNAYEYVANMFAGHFLCHNQVNPYAIVPISYTVIVIMAFLSDENKNKTTMMQKLISVGIIALSYVMISTVMYVYNTEFKASIIIGVQGRYFIPLLMMAVLFANNKKLDIKEEKLTNIAIIANYIVYLAMMVRFFA